MRHGTRSKYRHDGCRCDACREANNAYQVRWRHAREGTPPHGTVDGYTNWLCRCADCLEAHTRADDERGARRHLARYGLDLDDVLKASPLNADSVTTECT